MRWMSGSSCVPSTWLCEARICSISVEPARGNPTTKIGSRLATPQSSRAAKKAGVQVAICRAVLVSKISGRYRLSARWSALPRRVTTPRPGDLAAILQRLAECEAEMDAIYRGGAVGCVRSAHAGDLVLLEAIGLEVGEAPIGVAEIGAGRDRGAIGGDRRGQLSDGLERMAVP